MIINDRILKYGEKTVFSLRELYSAYGYAPYKMSKFEEYDLYVRNKDFLISDSVITFTDTNGKLMALKPDVTLSIIKNSKDISGFVQKLYYDENVYRVSESNHSFKEVMQVGLECIGDIDTYCLGEVVSLAAKSLLCVSGTAVLDISHLGIIKAILCDAGVPEASRGKIIALMGDKITHELSAYCDELGISDEKKEAILKLSLLHGSPDTVFPILKQIFSGIDDAPIRELYSVIDSLGDEERAIVNIDFSVVSDIKYYNGVVFKGFVKNVPESVLSGGQYDSLMKQMNRKSSAIGFAVYLDHLNRLEETKTKYNADAVLLYESGEDISVIRKAVEKLSENGNNVSVQRTVPEGFKYRALYKLWKGEVITLENNA